MKLPAIKILTISVFCFSINQFTLPAKAESINNSHSHKGREIHNPVPEEYRQIEFLAALSLVSLSVLLGTGKSMKFAKKPASSSKKKKYRKTP